MYKTACTKCGASISYKTKRPKYCKKCKPKTGIYRKPKVPPQRSKKESQMQYTLNEIFPEADYIDNGYYSWLKSPKNAPMQIDRLYPVLKLAWEYDGQQHHHFNPYMHRTQEAFEYLQTCDRLKDKLLKKLGYTLIRIKYDKVITKEYLITRLKEAGVWDSLKTKTKVRE